MYWEENVEQLVVIYLVSALSSNIFVFVLKRERYVSSKKIIHYHSTKILSVLFICAPAPTGLTCTNFSIFFFDFFKFFIIFKIVMHYSLIN